MIAAFSVEILLFSSYNKQVKREWKQVTVHEIQGADSCCIITMKRG